MTPLLGPANYKFFGVLPAMVVSIILAVSGIALFTYIMARRAAPLFRANPDERAGSMKSRVKNVLIIWLGQVRQPRYMLAGVLHIVIFAGFLTLSVRSVSLVMIGFVDGFVMPGFGGWPGSLYVVLKDYAATFVLIACVIAAVRRGLFTPARYAVPEKYGHDHTSEAVFVLGIISTLMISESIFDASELAALSQSAEPHTAAPLTLVWIFRGLLSSVSVSSLQTVHMVSYFVHDLTFFFFLCFLPLGKHFHVITSIFNVFFMRVEKGNIKPVMHGVPEDQLDDIESFGVKQLEDFTWKHMLDFYSCADCGRCSDNCPANAAGRPLSPRFITIKARDLVFQNYPLSGKIYNSKMLVEDIYTEDEVWSCTTCGACEEECPLGIEYIDKIVDLRRGMVDEGMVPQSLQKPLKALEKRGNPYGKMEKKRADWTKDEEFSAEFQIKDLSKEQADTLYFVDSVTSYDEDMQQIARNTSVILDKVGVDFGILGKQERDSGSEVLRFGEEMLYQELKERNIDSILETGIKNIVTSDPHAFNVLKNDYKALPPVEHITQLVSEKLEQNAISFDSCRNKDKIYTYHDPCYLGRHNELYKAPRQVLDAIDGLVRVEMKKNRDRSFCCGGGGLMLFYEPDEETRMGVLRVNMALEAGANVIITACPFCFVNIQDAIKVAGVEDRMEVMDFTQIVVQHLK